MKKYLCALSALAILGFGCSQTKNVSKEVTKESLETIEQKAYYAIGQNIGQSFKTQGLEEIDLDILTKGLQDALAEGTESFFSPEEVQTFMTEFQTVMQKKVEEKREKDAAANVEEGKKFLEENGKKEGVVTLPSGLQYKILNEGNGPKPSVDQTVECHYEGRLISGKVFDSSIERGQPAQFALNGVIKGWTEALQLMPVGSKWQLYIPSELAYGQGGAGNDIGPNSTLVFDVELLKIMAK